MAKSVSGHRWRFRRLGGFDQVMLESGTDICHLPELDQKLWAALSCPTTGVDFDAHTLALLDTDGDGRIRVPEIIAAVNWTCGMLRDPSDLLAGEAGLPVAAINADTEDGDKVLRSVRAILDHLGKPDADRIDAADTADTNKIITSMRFNGDGVVPPAAAGDDKELAAAIEDILRCVGGVPDRSGAEGLSAEPLERFVEQANAYQAWYAEAEADAAQILPLGDATEAAAAAFATLQKKIDDYFTRAALVGFDPAATTALNPAEADYAAVALTELSAANAELARFPLARATAGRGLPLQDGVNPAWAEGLQHFRDAVVEPLLGPLDTLDGAQWRDLSGRFSAHAAWMERMQGAAVHALGIERVRELLAADMPARITALIAEDEKLCDEVEAIAAVDRLIHYRQYLYRLLRNFVSLEDFYSEDRRAIFQAGTLFLDGRSCELCVEVGDVAAHANMAVLSGTYLAYCDCTRRGGSDKRTIVAAFTNGDSDNLMVGRHGVFYDRAGRDWDAVINRIIDQPISVRQAFWGPYKRLARMISEQIQKFAGAREKAVEDASAKGVGDLSAKVEGGKAEPAAPFDIAKFAGIFAAAGLALGAIGTALAAVVTGFLGLTWWQVPLAVLGIILAISGPSMLMAYMKLRRRNLGPVLDANGWAVNTLARINLPFGTTLTRTAVLPPGARRSLQDPFAQKRQPWGLYLLLLILIASLFGAWRVGWLDGWLAQMNLSSLVSPAQPSADAPPQEADGDTSEPAPEATADAKESATDKTEADKSEADEVKAGKGETDK